MTGQENFQALVKQKTEEMRQWQLELEEREQQLEVDYQLLDKKITELEEFDKYLKTWDANLKSKEQAWNKKKGIETENFTKELLSEKRKLKSEIPALQNQLLILKCDIEENETKIKGLLSEQKLASKMLEEEKQRVNNILSDERRALETHKEKLDKLENELSYREKRVAEEKNENDQMFKKLWHTWLFWIIVAIISAIISVFFVHGYLASDNRALNTYNEAISSYNEKINDIDTKIYKKNESLKDKYEDLETQYCGTENEWENLCIGTNEDIEQLSDSIEDLEQQKKELVKPQEPTL